MAMSQAPRPSKAPAPEEGARLQTERNLAAAAYLLTWLTGLIILLVAERRDRYARWHAIQAIGLGIAWAIIGGVLGILGAIAGLTTVGHGEIGWAFGPFTMPFMFGGIAGALQLGLIVLIVVLAVKAYNGETIRLPVLAGIADDNA